MKTIYGFSDSQANAMVQGYMQKMVRYLVEVVNIEKVDAEFVPHILDVTDAQKIEAALQKGRGLIVLVTHSGNFELLGRYFGFSQFLVNSVVNSPAGNVLHEFLDKNRSNAGIRLINTRTDNMYRMSLQALRRNEIVIIAADTGATDSNKNMIADFLNHEIPVATGWAILALRTNAPVIPAFTYSTLGEFKHHSVLGDPIDNLDCVEEYVEEALDFYSHHFQNRPDEWLLALSERETKKSFRL